MFQPVSGIQSNSGLNDHGLDALGFDTPKFTARAQPDPAEESHLSTCAKTTLRDGAPQVCMGEPSITKRAMLSKRSPPAPAFMLTVLIATVCSQPRHVWHNCK
jgi:hypothetical protein